MGNDSISQKRTPDRLTNTTPERGQDVCKDNRLLSGQDAVAIVACCVALLACIWISHPFADTSFNDDWTYSRVALRLAETGRFEYNGWGSPTVIFQSIWGSLFIRLFGFSFDILRLATIPFSLGFVAVTYLLAREAGLRKTLAVFAALTLAVSPLFVPLAASFMTEPYSCFFSLLCAYAAVRATRVVDPRREIRWLWVLTLSGILGGSNRQSVWAAPLFLIPYLYWNKRSSRLFRIHSAIAYLICLIALLYIVHAFGQKYGATELPLREWPSILQINGLGAVHGLVSLFLEALLLCLPALLALSPLLRRLRRRQVFWILFGSILGLDFLWSVLGPVAGIAPFLGNTLTPFGIFEWIGHGLGSRPQVLRLWERVSLTFLLLVSIAAWMILTRATVGWKTLPRKQLSIYLILVLPYLALLLPGALLFFIYDRYLLPILPLLLIVILVPLNAMKVRVPALAWGCLLLFSIYGIVITHDCYAELTARALIAREAAQRGIRSDHVSSGFERDGWFQISQTGHILPVLYGRPIQMDSTHFWFWFYTTAIQPEYVAISSYGNAVPSDALIVLPFKAWSFPHKRTIALVRKENLSKE